MRFIFYVVRNTFLMIYVKLTKKGVMQLHNTLFIGFKNV
ncbi:hypothetical protein RG47T_0938 [Mucilaginibacter polytrichastri]|uniref:Uncharacterized protein n=1 Tax=Mucilaginibacter polytrichastri TaxID=1302689 RepID=A0A1Q5ZUN7_9SPHI|nr:hypothetical protein RG47T_0938 [Mucilaginibacter polytrichastri]